MEDRMDKITINYNEKPCYEIYLKHDFNELPDAIKALDVSNRKVCIVTDSTVGELYLNQVTQILKNCTKEVVTYTFLAGEQSKTLNVIYEIYETLIQAEFDRNDLLVALGGGVVGDMTGFAAATYLRGIRFIQIPTSLLAMVDSSIGGKTAVDFKAYKNMVGAFHQPSLVYMNLSVLTTLTKEQYRSGMGEIVKHALIRNADNYLWLKEHHDDIMSQNMKVVEEMIYESLLVKKAVVERDPKEVGERAILNYGHTLGHAIEKHMNFNMLHGDCVSVGVVAAAYISVKRGYIKEEELEDICQTLKSFTLPVSIPYLDIEDVLKTTKSDKKMDGGKVKFILILSIGNAIIDKTVTKEEMKEALQYIMQ